MQQIFFFGKFYIQRYLSLLMAFHYFCGISGKLSMEKQGIFKRKMPKITKIDKIFFKPILSIWKQKI